jgi:hypothetical protein
MEPSMSDDKPTPGKPEDAEKITPAAEEAPVAEAPAPEASDTAPEEAAPVLEAVGSADDEAAEETQEVEAEEEVVPWINHRLNPQIVEELLAYMLNQKRAQDVHYTNIEIVDIDWEKEEVHTLRNRPSPLDPSPETFSFVFLERFRDMHEKGVDSLIIEIQ